jgi:putative Mg2+ transporter-C (MgtC) family protein
MAVVRIAAAGLLGIIIGKASRSDPGARLFALVAMGSALMSVVSTEFFKLFVLPGNVDPGRLAAQVISALGFIGSGLIWLGDNKEVRGTGAAAGLWLTAILGMLLGAGLTTVTAGAAIFTVLVLVFGNLINVDKILGPKTENIYVKEKEDE